MGSFWQLINAWEIQLLVLLSFILQVFLFFTGSLRRRSTNALLRGTIWLAYLGADVVAIYALGILSRNDSVAMGGNELTTYHPLAFLWAPFLLIHLGGQDTITAFAIEDNNLWLRHMLNMVVQVTLALYVFWRSTSSKHSAWLLAPGIFLFVAGIIKYGERTMALLMNGNLNSFGESGSSSERSIPFKSLNEGYDGYICGALHLSPSMRGLFAGRWSAIEFDMVELDHVKLFKLLDIELCVMYSDLYTKAILLRTMGGIVLRLISQVSIIIALVLFAVSGKAGYGTADVVITYTLLIGGLFLEVSAVLTTVVASPWTWAWLQHRGSHRLARISRYLLLSCGCFGWQETRPLWSNAMGQYRFLSYRGDDAAVESLSQRVMSKVRKVAGFFGIGETRMKLFWVSKILDTTYEALDDKITECLVTEIRRIQGQGEGGTYSRKWRYIGPLVEHATTFGDFTYMVSMLHLLTECCLKETPNTGGDDGVDLPYTCRKLSNYMLYLVAAHPESASLLLEVSAERPDFWLELLPLQLFRFLPEEMELNMRENYKETLERS
ncbi:hypothetical protein HU200_008293 [Digitaria exilis]|uniref:DUF4220 domain-containing protein n=1 Tax=Digitaria exilis TaxID=1010633 RepID=A0A835FN75_9POAL|nr:hypothetical protein HU200_008293 [Digitaria exilis]